MESRFPGYVTFDCYGTLINFQIDATIRRAFRSRLPEGLAAGFLATAERYRFDEVLGPWKPYRDVISRSTERTARRYGVAYSEDDGEAIYRRIPTWGPHPGVTPVLRRLSASVPLVILSNAADEQIGASVDNLGAPFHRVFTAEQARAYKPRLQAFRFLLEQLDCGPDDIVHVSSSCQYDLRPATDLGVRRLVLVNRRDEAVYPWLRFQRVDGIESLPDAITAS
jgi:2-haloacid dehalogenase